MKRLCLDTSAYTHFRRNHAPVVKLVARAIWVGVPAVVLGELRHGFQQGARRDENEAALAAFLSEPVVHVQDIDDDAATSYAEIVSALKRAGSPVPTNDAWIAAVALRDGAGVATYDHDFARITMIRSEILDLPSR